MGQKTIMTQSGTNVVNSEVEYESNNVVSTQKPRKTLPLEVRRNIRSNINNY